MRKGFIVALCALVLAGSGGCGGCSSATSMSEMKRRAIRRPKDEDTPTSTATPGMKAAAEKKQKQATKKPEVAKKPAATEKPRAGSGNADGETDGGDTLPKESRPASAETAADDSPMPRTRAAPEASPQRVGPTLTISADGQQVVFGSHDGVVGLFDVREGKLQQSFQAQPVSITAVGINRDHSRVVAGNADGVLQLFRVRPLAGLDAFERARLQEDQRAAGIVAHSGSVASVAFHPTADAVASGGEDGMVRIWHTDPRPPGELVGHEKAKTVAAVAIARDAPVLATMDDSAVRIWSVESGETIRVVPAGNGSWSAVAISQDGRHVAAGQRSGSIHLWDVSRPDQPSQLLVGHERAIFGIGFDDSGKRLVSKDQGGHIKYWRLPLPRPRTITSGQGNRHDWSVSGKGQYVSAVEDDHAISILRTSDGHQVKRIHDDTRQFRCVALSSTNRWIAAGDAAGGVTLWKSSETSRRYWFPLQQEPVRHLRAHPTAPVFASSDTAGNVTLFSIPEPQPAIAELGQSVHAMTVGIDPKRVAVGLADGSLQLINLDGGGAHHFQAASQASVSVVRIDPRSKLLLAGYDDGQIGVWKTAPAEASPIVTFRAHQGAITAVRLDPDRQQLVTVGEDATCKLWKWPFDRHQTLGRDKGAVTAIAVDGKGELIVTGGQDKRIRIVRTAGHASQHTRAMEVAAAVTSLAVDRAGARVAAGTSDGAILVFDSDQQAAPAGVQLDGGPTIGIALHPGGHQVGAISHSGEIRVWPMPLAQSTRLAAAAAGSVTSAAFSPDRRMVATGHSAGEIRITSVADGRSFTLSGHTAAITSIDWSGNSARLLTGSRDQTVRLWDLRSRQSLHTLSGHGDAIRSARFVSDDDQLVSADHGGTVKVWESASGKQIDRPLSREPATVSCLEVSADGSSCALAGRDGTIDVFSAPAMQRAGRLEHGTPVTSIAWSPDGRSVASAGTDGRVRIWNVKTGKAVRTLEGHSAPVTQMTFSGGGSFLLASCDAGGTLKHWDAHGKTVQAYSLGALGCRGVSAAKQGAGFLAITADGALHGFGNLRARIIGRHDGASGSLTYSRDGRFLITGGRDRAIRVWDVEQAAAQRTLVGSPAAIVDTAVTSDDRHVVAACADRQVRVWTMSDGKLVRTLPCATMPLALSISGNDRRLFVRTEDRLEVYDTQPWSWRESVPLAATSAAAVAGMPGGGSCVTAATDGRVQRISVRLASSVRPDLPEPADVTSNSDGTVLATAAAGGKLQVWDVASKLVAQVQHAGAVRNLTLSGDGKRLAAVAANHGVIVWDAYTGTPLATFDHRGPVSRLHFSPDGQLLACQHADQVLVFVIASGKLRRYVRTDAPIARFALLGDEALLIATKRGQLQRVRLPGTKRLPAKIGKPQSFCFARGGDWLVAAGQQGSLQAWRWRDGEEAGKFVAEDHPVRFLAVTEDGRRLAAAGVTGTIRIWDVESQQMVQSLKTPTQISGIRLSPDGGKLATLSPSGVGHIWDVNAQRAMQKLAHPSGHVDDAQFLGADRVLVSGSAKSPLVVQPLGAVATADTKSPAAAGLALARDGSLVVAANDQTQVGLWDATGSHLRDFELPAGSTISAVAVHPAATQLAAVARSEDRQASGYLRIWNRADGRVMHTAALPCQPVSLAFSQSGQHVVVAGADRRLRIYDVAQGIVLQQIACELAIRAVAFSRDDRMIVAGHEGGAVRLYPLYARQVIKAHEDAVVSVAYTPDGQSLLTGAADGTVSWWKLTGADQPHMKLTGGPQAPARVRLAATGREVVATYDDPAHTVCIWHLGGPVHASAEISPATVLKHPTRLHAALTTHQGLVLVTAGDDGPLSFWDIRSGKELSKLKGHKAAVRDVVHHPATATLVSASADREVRVWNLPHVSPTTSPVAKPRRSFEMAELPKRSPVTTQAAQTSLSHPLDARIAELERDLRSAASQRERDEIRLRLLRARRQRQMVALNRSPLSDPPPAGTTPTGTSTPPVDGAVVFQRISALREKIAAAPTAAEKQQFQQQLVKTQREHVTQSARVLASIDPHATISYDMDHENEMASLTTDFTFDSEVFRPVKLLVSSDMSTVVAARRSAKLSDDKVVKGSLRVWDVFSGQQLRSWDSVQNQAVDAIRFVPGEQSIYSLPAMHVFNIPSGTSRYVAALRCHALSPRGLLTGERLHALGMRGEPLAESHVLTFLGGKELASRGAGFSAYEAMVTALAFANRQPRIAFVLRQRTSHKLIIADPETMEVASMHLLEEHRHREPWHSGGAVGITSLAFSPDDRYLVTHGKYSDKEHRAVIWEVDWRKEPSRENWDQRVVKQESSFFHDRGSQSICFVGRRPWVAFETRRGVAVMDLEAEQAVGDIRLPAAHWGRPEVAFSSDGRWLAAGDDRGHVFIWGLEDGSKRKLTPDGRPAHDGPIVGVAFADEHSVSGTIDYLVTAGEENRIKVWNLVGRVDAPPQAPPAATAARP